MSLIKHIAKSIGASFIDALEKQEIRIQKKKQREKEQFEEASKRSEIARQEKQKLQRRLEQARQIEIIENVPIHPKFKNIVQLASYLCPTNSVTRFIFEDNKEDRYVCNYSEEHKEIIINLYELFIHGLGYVMNPGPRFSFRAEIWLQFMLHTFKNFLRACELNGDEIQVDLLDIIPVLQEDSATGRIISYVGQKYDVEPPSIKEDQFFGPLITSFIEDGIKNGEVWAIHQKDMLSYICMFPMEINAGPYFIRDYFKWATKNLNSPNWQQYVPAFNATEKDDRKAREWNRDWQKHLEDLDREEKDHQRQMAALGEGERQVRNAEVEMEKERKNFILYINHCWNCRAQIDSRECKKDPGYGYYCNKCGKSLRDR